MGSVAAVGVTAAGLGCAPVGKVGRIGEERPRCSNSLFSLCGSATKVEFVGSLSSGCDLSGLSDLSASEGPSKRMSRCQTRALPDGRLRGLTLVPSARRNQRSSIFLSPLPRA